MRESFSHAAKHGDPCVHLFQNILEMQQKPGLTEVGPERKAEIEAGIEQDVTTLLTALTGKAEGNQFALIFTTSTPRRLRDIAARVEAARKIKLEKEIEKKFKDPFEDSLQYILAGARDEGDGKERAKRDARLIEGTMKGLGTRDTELGARLVKVSWDKKQLGKIREEYKRAFPGRGSLRERVKGETSGIWEDFLVAVVDS